MRASGHRRAEALGSLYKARLRGLLHHEWAVSLKLLQRADDILCVGRAGDRDQLPLQSGCTQAAGYR